jgi:peroxiredoxin
LADFHERWVDFEALGALVVAASTDSMQDAKATADEYGIAFPVGYDLLSRDVAAVTGAYFDPATKHLHATGIIIGPDGKVAAAVFSTGAVGRLTAKASLGLIRSALTRA